jgi:exopolysaccharide biosynthesis polyprenyl glycosylphosphotransferase
VIKEKSFILGRISLFIDAGLTILAYWFAFFVYWLLYQASFTFEPFGYHILPVYQQFATTFGRYSYLLIFIGPLFPLIYETNGLYSSMGFRRRREIAVIILRSIVVGLMAIMVVMVFFNYGISRPMLIGFGAISFVLVYIKELFILEYIEMTRKSGRNFRYVIIVGIGEIARKAIVLARDNPKWGFKITGCVVPPYMKDEKEVNGYPVLGIYEHMAQVLKANPTDLVLFAVDKRYIAEAEEAIYACETQGVETWMIPDYFDIKIARVNFDKFFNLPVMLFRTTPEFSWSLLIKGILDRIFSVFMIIILSPVFLVVSILIKATSKGTVFFSQKRSGLHGKLFTVHKFRTMVRDADAQKEDLLKYNEQDAVTFKISNDPRVTGIGRWLRKLSIDELPQLFNVASGKMSIIGPRPLVPEEVEKFKIWQRRRLSMKPGITCLWVIRGRKNVEFENWMKLDLEYIDNWSLWLDIKIFFKTIPVVLFGKNV